MKSEISESVTRNFSVMFAAQMVNWVSSFALLMFLPRYLGSEEYGRLYLALSINMMLSLVIGFGGNFLIPKEVARSEKEGAKIFSSYILLRIILWILSIGVILLISNLLNYSDEVALLILILAIGKLWQAGSSALKAYFEGIERTEYPSIGKVVERMSVAILAVGALLLGADSVEIAVIMTLGALFNLLVVVWFSRNFIKPEFSFNSKVFKLLSSGLPYFLFSLFSVIYYRIDAVMLGAMATDEVVGWYGGAYRFFDAIMILPILYKTAIFPIFSKLWDDKEGILETTIGKSIKLMLILAVPVAISIFIFSEPIIQFFMGLDEFGPSVFLLQIFALSIPIIYVDFILSGAIMGAANKQKAWAMIGFFGIVLNVVANYFLIPYAQTFYGNGGVGAAAATFATELFIMISAVILLPKNYLKRFKPVYLVKPLAAGAVMAIFCWFMLQTWLYWILTVILGLFVYLIALIALKVFSTNEIEMLRNSASFRSIKKTIFSGKNVNAQ